MSHTSPFTIRTGVSLKPHNTFQVEAVAGYWAELRQSGDMHRLMETEVYQDMPRYILGGGSNLLFTHDYPGLIIKNSIPGISLTAEDADSVWLRAGGGVIWDELVSYTLNRGWGGLENLSMIPGLCGAAPIQNIGAYGVELESVFESLDAINLATGETEQFDHGMCRFGYRSSIFKTTHTGRYLIKHITLRLQKSPELHLEYGNLRDVLSAEDIDRPDIRDVGRAVRKIRTTKLPDPAETGNAGSFFKNPVIPSSQFELLRERWPDIPSYPAGNRIKVPAAWLIDQCGFRGKRLGDAGVHERHALIIVNHGNATGADILKLAETIQNEVRDRFGILLEPEVNIL
ncbi:MAG: UDP-N-acetylmuramate dehydrogenase [Cyclonatronaceae bacterium]